MGSAWRGESKNDAQHGRGGAQGATAWSCFAPQGGPAAAPSWGVAKVRVSPSPWPSRAVETPLKGAFQTGRFGSACSDLAGTEIRLHAPVPGGGVLPGQGRVCCWGGCRWSFSIIDIANAGH